MDEEVVVDELLNGKVGGDGEEVPGHNVADADAVKCFSHLGLPEASLRAGTDEPPGKIIHMPLTMLSGFNTMSESPAKIMSRESISLTRVAFLVACKRFLELCQRPPRNTR